jgi:hypothetical protein
MSKTSLDPGSDEGERRPGFRAAGASLPRIVGPIVARQGGGLLTRLKSEWATIVGPELAVATWPELLARDGMLKLRVTPAKALEVQHRTPLVIERVNLFFGREAVTRLALVQGPLPLVAPAPHRPAPMLRPGEAAALGQQLSSVTSPELREALARLGRHVIAAPT